MIPSWIDSMLPQNFPFPKALDTTGSYWRSECEWHDTRSSIVGSALALWYAMAAMLVLALQPTVFMNFPSVSVSFPL